MILNNKLSNKDCIGKHVAPYPDPKSSWIDASPCEYEGAEDEYYTDAWGTYVDGCPGIVYMYGEDCIIRGWDEDSQTVRLFNNSGEREIDFEIPYEQYKADFGIDWN